MSNRAESSTEDFVMWRKRLKLRSATLQLLEDTAKSSVRTPEQMAAYIIEEYFRRGERKATDA